MWFAMIYHQDDTPVLNYEENIINECTPSVATLNSTFKKHLRFKVGRYSFQKIKL